LGRRLNASVRVRLIAAALIRSTADINALIDSQREPPVRPPNKAWKPPGPIPKRTEATMITASSTLPRWQHDLCLVIRAEITGANEATACGLTAHGHAPVLTLCRQLIDLGHEPESPLAAYRGNTLCLLLHSIEEGAALTVEDDRLGKPKFRRYRG
jgi:hypothetical protein